MSDLIILAIILLGGMNLLRIAMLLIATDIHEIKEHKLTQRTATAIYKTKNPRVSVIIPAYNEELSIYASIDSVCKNTYKNFEVIVVDDGSKDTTSKIVKRYIKTNKKAKIRLIKQKNSGKAHALNNAIQQASGSLIMCLDADSLLDCNAIKNAVQHFQKNPKLVGMASNVHVTNIWSPLGVAQRFEYLLSYRIKRALNVLQSEYIIGGVGSTFKKSFIQKIGMYDTDTMTEDIDLTMKIVARGNKEYQLGFGYDVHTYTQGVLNLRDLIKQRFRWKYGRMQSFIKNKNLFFNTNKKYSKTLTMYQLPYAVFGEFSLFFEPLFIIFIFFNALAFGDIYSILWILGFMIFYMGAIILNDTAVPLKNRLIMFTQTPVVWILFYILTFVEFCALVKCLLRMSAIRQSMASSQASQWEHVQRTAIIPEV